MKIAAPENRLGSNHKIEILRRRSSPIYEISVFPDRLDDRIEMLAAEIGVTAADLKQFDFRDEAEYIRQLMFADPAAGMVFRTVRSKIQGGMPAEEIHERLQESETSGKAGGLE